MTVGTKKHIFGPGEHVLARDSAAAAGRLAREEVLKQVARMTDIPTDKFDDVLKRMFERTGADTVKNEALGAGCVLLRHSTLGWRLAGSMDRALRFSGALEQRFGWYLLEVNDRAVPREKRVKIPTPLHYRTVSFADFQAKPVNSCIADGIIPVPDFLDWFLQLVVDLASGFEEATRYKLAQKGLRPYMLAVHSQQGVLHIHIAYVLVDHDHRRLGLQGSRVPGQRGGNRTFTGDLGMAQIGPRRQRKYGFTPVPQVIRRAKRQELVLGWELLDAHICAAAKAKVRNPDTGEVIEHDIGDTWDIQLNDLVDERLHALALRFPALSERLDLALRDAIAANDSRVTDARKVLNLDVADQLATTQEQLAAVEFRLSASIERGDALAAENARLREELSSIQTAVPSTALTPNLVYRAYEAAVRRYKGLSCIEDEHYLSTSFRSRVENFLRGRTSLMHSDPLQLVCDDYLHLARVVELRAEQVVAPALNEPQPRVELPDGTDDRT